MLLCILVVEWLWEVLVTVSCVVPDVLYCFCYPFESGSSNSSVRGIPWYESAASVRGQGYVSNRVLSGH